MSHKKAQKAQKTGKQGLELYYRAHATAFALALVYVSISA